MSFLDLEQVLVDRLRAELPDTVKVFSAAELSAVQANSQIAPAVHVIYGGFKVDSTSTDRATAKITQTWYVVPVVRNVASQIDGAGARKEASAHIDLTLQALLGWQFDRSQAPLELIDPPPSRWIRGLGYHPLAFRTSRSIGAPRARP